MVLIHRAMRADDDDLPVVERSNEGLGVRIELPVIDLPVVDGLVRPGNGMSVFGDPRKMHKRHRPRILPGGKSLLPLFGLDEADLPDGLRLTPPNADTHMVVEPAREMPLDEYESLLTGTRPKWRRILNP